FEISSATPSVAQSIPQMKPRPRTLPPSKGCRSATASRRDSTCLPRRSTRGVISLRSQRSSAAAAVTKAKLLPRKVPLCSPGAQGRVDQHNRERQAVAAHRLRQRDHVRADAGVLEAEEPAGAAAADLDVVDDEQDAVAPAQRLETAQPVGGGDVDPALALHGLDDHRGRLVQPAAGVAEGALEVVERIDALAEITVEGH